MQRNTGPETFAGFDRDYCKDSFGSGISTKMNPLVEWAVAREALRKQKELGGPAPWTDNTVLQTYRFCNVRRRDDRVSLWLRANVLNGNNLNLVGFQSFLLFAAFCRLCNWPPTIAEIMKRGLYPVRQIDWAAIAAVLDERKAQKQKVWTGAYMIKAPPKSSQQSKAQWICQQVIGTALFERLPQIANAINTNTRRTVWQEFMQVKNFGSFYAGQVVDDLGWTVLLSGAKDVYTWAPQGPGSLRGFNRMMGLSLKTPHKEDEWCTQLQKWRAEVIEALGKGYQDLTAMDLQNSLCETDKYLRVKNGEGRPRSKYRPETAY